MDILPFVEWVVYQVTQETYPVLSAKKDASMGLRERERTLGGREKGSLNEVVSGGLSNGSSHQEQHEAMV